MHGCRSSLRTEYASLNTRKAPLIREVLVLGMGDELRGMVNAESGKDS